MPGPIDDLQQAGFSDSEIGDWSAQQRSTLSQAGFKDNEIDGYLGGGVTVPDEVPQALKDRFEAGMRADRSMASAIGKGVKEGFGDQPLGITPENKQALQKMGILSDPSAGRPATPLRLFRDTMVNGAAMGVEALSRAWSAGIGGVVGAIGEEAERGGMEERQAEKMKADVNLMANLGLMLSGARTGPHGMARIDVDPMGRVSDTPIGGLPKTEDFVNAAKVVGDEGASLATQHKLLTLYTDHGLHPAEVAHDASHDVTISQSLLSDDKADLPFVAPPIVQFRKDAEAINSALPAVQEGLTRLWRGNRPGEIGRATQFTNDLPGIALPFRKVYGGNVSYVDVPTADLAKYEQTAGAAPGAEFGLPPDVAAKATDATPAPKPMANAEQAKAAIYDDARAQILAASPDLGEAHANAYATELASRYAARAERLSGVDPLELYREDNLQVRGGAGQAAAVPGIEGFHGSPFTFDAFDLSKRETGLGDTGQRGVGINVSTDERVASQYTFFMHHVMNELSGKGYSKQVAWDLANTIALARDEGIRPNDINLNQYTPEYRKGLQEAIGIASSMPGNRYRVRVRAPESHFMDWEKPIGEQSAEVQEGLRRAGIGDIDPRMTAGQWFDREKAVRGNAELSETLRDAGIAGIAHNDIDLPSARNYVVFDPRHVDITHRNGEPVGGTRGRSFDQPLTVPPFYSAVERAVTSAKQAKASPEQWLATLRNTPGVKPEEVEWLGLEDWLKEQKGPVTREQVADYVRANAVEVKEVMRGGQLPEQGLPAGYEIKETPWGEWQVTDPEGQSVSTQRTRELTLDDARRYLVWALPQQTKFTRWTLPGGVPGSDREFVLTLPAKEMDDAAAAEWAKQFVESTGDKWDNLSPESQASYIQAAKEQAAMGKSPGNFSSPSGHAYGDKASDVNRLAMVRTNDRVIDGKKTLFIEEMQDDWAQKIFAQARQKALSEGLTKGSAELSKRINELSNDAGFLKEIGVPDRPWKRSEDWSSLALKRMIKYAAEQSGSPAFREDAPYEKLAWTTGETQAERYDLSKHVAELYYWRNPNGTFSISADDHGGHTVINQESVKQENLDSIVGKEIAERMLSGEGDDSPKEEGVKVIRGENLKIGGEGMRGFYDRILPAAANKLGKKFGAKVVEGKIDTDKPIPREDGIDIKAHQLPSGRWIVADSDTLSLPPDELQKLVTEEELPTFATQEEAKQSVGGGMQTVSVHTLDITPALREAAVSQGFPLFQPGEGAAEPRGRVTFTDSGAAIQMFQRADASTFGHEASHLYLEQLAKDAADPRAIQSVRDDLETVLKWLGIDEPGQVGTEHHEQFARGFEQYRMEGKAPSAGLARVFEQFREWLTGIYKNLTSLGVPISGEIRGVMDRMLATDEEIAARGKEPPPTEPPSVGPPAIGEPVAAAGAGGAGPPPLPSGSALGMPPEPPRPPPGSLADAERRIDERMSVGEKDQTRRMTFARLYTHVMDKLFPISQAVKGATEGEPLATSENPYQLARLFAGIAGKAEHMLQHGTFDFHSYEENGQALKDILAPVNNVLQGFRRFAAAAHAAELEKQGIKTGFPMDAAEQVVRAGRERYGQTMLDLVAYQNRMAKYLQESGVLSKAGYEAMTAKYPLYVPFNVVMGDGVITNRKSVGASLQAVNPVKAIKGSERVKVDPLENVIRNTYLFTAMAEKNAVGTKLIDMLLGAAEPETRVATEIPREEPIEGTFTEVPGEIASPESHRQLEPLAERLPPVPRDKVDAALKEFLDTHGGETPDELVDFMRSAGTPDGKDTVTIFRDGKRETYRVDPDLARSFKGLDAPTIGFIERLLAFPANLLRAGAVLTPDFAMRHLFRTTIYSGITPTSLKAFTPVDMAKGLFGLISKDEDYQNWLKSGGSNNAMISLDRRYLQQNLDRLTQQTGLMTRAWNVLGDPAALTGKKLATVAKLPMQMVGKFAIDPLRMITELAESAGPLGAFKRAMRETEATPPPPAPTSAPMLGGPGTGALSTDVRPAEPGETSPNKATIQAAGWTSRNVGVDVARSGASLRAYNMITAFANITLQDTDRIVRAFKDDLVKTFLLVASYITIPSALLWWANHDDPRYHEIPQWQRDMTWIIFGKDNWTDLGPAGPEVPTGAYYRIVGGRLQRNDGIIFRLPKPFGAGVLFGTGMERALEAMAGNPDAYKEFAKSLKDTMVPQLYPTVAAPMLEQWANRSSFTNRTLITGPMEKQLPEYQYTPYTTETAKALGKLIAAFPGMRAAAMDPNSLAPGVAHALSSPILMENYLRGWTGTLGVYALQFADAALRKTGVLPDPVMPASTLADIPIIRAFTVRYPTASAQSIQDFYDGYDQNKGFYDTWQAQAKDGNADAMAKIQAAGGPGIFVQLTTIRQALTEHSQLIRDIYKDQTATPDEKRQLIDTLYYAMIQIGQQGKAMLRQVDETAGKMP